MSEDAARCGGSSKESNVDPPQLSADLPLLREITTTSKSPELPIDVLLLTVDDTEFLACYKQLKDPFRCYYAETGHVYFNSVGSQQRIAKVALMRCHKGSDVPGGSTLAVKNAAIILRPRGVISVGTCRGLNFEKTKLGDVVVSAKLTTHDTSTPVSNKFGKLILTCADGWNAPLKQQECRDVKVHRGELLSDSGLAECSRNDLVTLHPGATAIEIGGGGKYSFFFLCRLLMFRIF